MTRIIALALESASSWRVTLPAPLCCLPPEIGDQQDRLPITRNERLAVALPHARNPALGSDVGAQADKRGGEYKAVSEDSLAFEVDPAVELREPLKPLSVEKLTLPRADQARIGRSRHGAERRPGVISCHVLDLARWSLSMRLARRYDAVATPRATMEISNDRCIRMSIAGHPQLAPTAPSGEPSE
jgi:hypothetical protein